MQQHTYYGYSVKKTVKEVLYSEEGDGEITIEVDKSSNKVKLVTCVDISTLYKEKRSKAMDLAQTFCTLSHRNLVQPISPLHIENNRLYIEMEAPENIGSWKSFCKKRFTTLEILKIFRQMCRALHYLHKKGLIHRDVHPTRIHQMEGVSKFNFIGMPYNFKKLLKKENFCGHVNYSAPELIQEKVQFTEKVDIWSLGCCLYYLCTKKDPFEGKDPQEIKQNILTGKLEKSFVKIDPILRKLLEACLVERESARPSARELQDIQNDIEQRFYGAVISEDGYAEDSSEEEVPSPKSANSLTTSALLKPLLAAGATAGILAGGNS